MNLKEFQAKQFLLEKGEQVGLGVALTLMVLMLILSLFMPKSGFFSGSPAAKAKELSSTTEQLDNALRTRQPTDRDLPEKREGKLIGLDTAFLNADSYSTNNWFEPRMRENKARRPPKIYNVEEAIAKISAIPIDTYLFRFNANPPSILILQDESRKGGGGGLNAPGGNNNPFQALLRQSSGPGGGGRGGSAPNNPFLQSQQSRLGNNNLGALKNLVGSSGNEGFETRWIPLDEWNPQQLTAHQLRPLRMAIIAGSFPYKEQIKEHQRRLRLETTDAVLGETVGEGDKKTAGFDFRGVEVERMEVDADGKKLSDWMDPQLKESYQLWLQHTYIPFEPEDPKYQSVEPNGGKGLVMPLLREFHANKQPNAPGLPGLNFPGMGGMMGAGKAMPQQPNLMKANQPQAQPDESKPTGRYPDVAAELPKIKETLKKIEEANPKQIAAAKKFQRPDITDPFNAESALPTDKSQAQNTGLPTTGNTGGESYIPDYVLVRVVDVNIEPGKYYRYRMKIKMANPNYQRPDVASPEYKEKETLESSDWYEVPGIVQVPQELFYYVVDEAQGMLRNYLRTLPPESAQHRQLEAKPPSPSSEQVVFQFHRWVESTQQSRKDTDLIPVGDWAVAERVFVARGEYIGRKVNVDLPIWKYTQNMFILPAENQKPSRKSGGKVPTGIDVDFGQDPLENNQILVDFEGGKGVTLPSNSKVKDDCAMEVLMLSPDGKLLARNSAKDTSDEERKERRKKVLERIQDVREGKGIEQ